MDKTAYALRLAEEGDIHYFPSRPLRFGKSLFLDTIKELYEGNEALFQGLAAHDRWDWSARHPVVRLRYAGGNFVEQGLAGRHWPPGGDRTTVRHGGFASSKPVDRVAPAGRPSDGGRRVRQADSRRIGRRAGGRGQPRLPARPVRCDQGLRCAYRDELRDRASRFAKTSLFSTANQFTDLTIDPRYSAVCGYAERALDEVFAPELERFQRDEICRFCNGYSWSGWGQDKAERVYNPYDVLMLFGDPKGIFQDYWYETGPPQFLAETLTKRGLVEVAGLDGASVSRAALLDFDVERIGTARCCSRRAT